MDNGVEKWFKDGELHREDGPAMEYTNGDKYWFINDKYHREYGPAIEYHDGCKEWFINGTKYTKKEYKQKMRLKKIEYITKH